MSLLNAKDGSLRSDHYLSPAGAWALAVGTSVGWGSFVITGNTYLKQAGLLGSVLGLLIGMAVMLIISRNYHVLLNRYPDAGGAYTYAKNVFGPDFGFIVLWFLILTYFAMLWANATSLPLFARIFLGDTFRFGYLYTIFGYEVYLGEILLTIAAVLLIGLLCIDSKRLSSRMMLGLVIVFTAAISICAGVCAARMPSADAFAPLFSPGGGGSFGQVLKIAFLSPWAFIGFENISHAAEGFAFPHQRTFRVLTVAVITTAALYILVLILSLTVYPPEFSSWYDYITHLDQLSGLKALPGFYAAEHYMGSFGVGLLTAALFALIITSLIGNTKALSRLLYSGAHDHIFPEKLGLLNKRMIPMNAILLIAGVSAIVPFLGRSAIGWIVDVTTLGATIIYGSVSACAWREGRNTGEKKDRLSGLSGMILMIVFGLALLISGIVSSGVMARESYILFALWGVLGFLFFRSVLVRNRMELYGSTGVVWAAMTVLILFTALAWILDVDRSSNADVLRIAAEQTGVSMETTLPDGSLTELGRKLQQISNRETLGTVAVFGLMTLALFLMLGNNRLMRKDSQEKKKELGIVKTIAYIDPLTGVKNKHSYVDAEEKLNLELDGAAPPAFAIAVCDVNGLKHINDTLGHKAGDEYIREASVVICNAFCHSPVFRTGGDEFVVILRDRDYDRREEIIRDFNATIEQNLKEERVVISLGMATFDPEQDRRVVTVFERADTLMYERKTELKGKGARTRD